MTQRDHITQKITEHISQLDTLELAIVLAWLKSGEMYKWGADRLVNTSTEESANHAEESQD